jgi:hypothetical protein
MSDSRRGSAALAGGADEADRRPQVATRSRAFLSTTAAAEINAEHLAATGKAREAIEHARRAGEMLLDVKAGLGHGEWLPWLKKNITFSERTAQTYMRLATRWDQLQSKSATAADLPLRDALNAIGNTPSPREPEAGRFTRQAVERRAEWKARLAGIDKLLALDIDLDTASWCLSETDRIIAEMVELRLVAERSVARLHTQLREHVSPEALETFLDPGFWTWLASRQDREARP